MQFTIRKFGNIDFTSYNDYGRKRGSPRIEAGKDTCHTERSYDHEYEWLVEITFNSPTLDGNGFITDRMALPELIEKHMFSKKHIPSCETMMVEIIDLIKNKVDNKERISRINVKFRAKRHSYPKEYYPFEYTKNFGIHG